MDNDNVLVIWKPTRYEKIKSIAVFLWSIDDQKQGHWTEYPYITMAGAIMEQLDPVYTVVYNPSEASKKMKKRLSKFTEKKNKKLHL